jgi:hypothetical protein
LSRFLPPDHSKGDERTIGGYAAVHGRPAALEGRDGFAYSVEVMGDAAPSGPAAAFGAFFMFLRWRRIGEEGVEGHLESEFLEFGATRDAAMDKLRAWPIERVQELLNAMIPQ